MYRKQTRLIWKLLILIELQLNVLLLRSQLIITPLIVNQLIFYNNVIVNIRLITNPFFITKILDIVLVPQYLYNLIKLFFLKKRRINDYIVKKAWPLIFFLASSIMGCLIVVEYPIFVLGDLQTQHKWQYSTVFKNKKKNDSVPISFQFGIFKIKLLEYLLLFHWKLKF